MIRYKKINLLIMVKFLELLQKLLTGFFIVLIALSLLTWFGVIDPFEKFENTVRDDLEESLFIKASSGDSDAQNKLGTLLYMQAKQNNGDYSKAIGWFEEAVEQGNPIALTNLAFAYKAGNGVPVDKEKAVELFYSAGLIFLAMDFPMDAKDSVHAIATINTSHPLKASLMNEIATYENRE